MGKGIITAALLGFALTAAAVAGVRPVPMTDGPNGTGRALDGAWSASCAASERVVGVRLREDGEKLRGIEPLCVRLGSGFSWVKEPAAPRVLAVAEAPDDGVEGNVLRVTSGEISQFRGSRAVLISVPRRSETRRVEGDMRIDGKARDVACPSGTYVDGLRIGSGRGGRLAALELICAGATGHSFVVALSAPKKTRKNKAVEAVSVSLIQCGRGRVNPHDGQAARALIGSSEGARVLSLGLVCARTAVPGAVAGAVLSGLDWLENLVPEPGAKGDVRTYRTPRWYAGADVAVCRDGSGRGSCAQASADRFCTTMGGYTGASFYVVGGYSADAIAAGGKRCPSGACRAFQSITCTG